MINRTFQYSKDAIGDQTAVIMRKAGDDSGVAVTIPLDENNREYRKIVKPFLDAGNAPDPAK